MPDNEKLLNEIKKMQGGDFSSYEDFYYNSQKIEENCFKYILDEEMYKKSCGKKEDTHQ